MVEDFLVLRGRESHIQNRLYSGWNLGILLTERGTKMTTDSNTKIPITEDNQVAGIPNVEIADTEVVLAISEHLIKQNIEAYEVLAK